MEKLFMILYPCVAYVSVSAYLPQIRSLLRAERAPLNISIRSWLMWVVSGSLTLGYGFFVLKDWLFCATTTITLGMTIYVTGLIIYNRYVRYGHCRNFLHACTEYFLCRPYFGVAEIRNENID